MKKKLNGIEMCDIEATGWRVRCLDCGHEFTGGYHDESIQARNTKFCPHCGAKIETTYYNNIPYSEIPSGTQWYLDGQPENSYKKDAYFHGDGDNKFTWLQLVYNPPYKEKAFKDLDIGIITRAVKYYCEKNRYNFSFCDARGTVGWYDLDDKLVTKSAEDFAKMIPFQPGWRYLDMQKS